MRASVSWGVTLLVFRSEGVRAGQDEQRDEQGGKKPGCLPKVKEVPECSHHRAPFRVQYQAATRDVRSDLVS